jgi:peroxiredoxin-like protein
MSSRTFEYHTTGSWTGDHGTLEARGRDTISVSIPTEFGGTGDRWSPEELLVGATQSCLVATFISLARRHGLVPSACRSSATGTLRSAGKSLAFGDVAIALQIAVETEEERQLAARIVEQAHKSCFVASSLRCPVTVDYTISIEPPPA